MIPFGPVNAPSYHSCMMGQFKKEWDDLFIEEMTSYANSGKILYGNKVVVINGDIYLGTTKLCYGTRTIIDDVFIWCSNIACILVYFDFFVKYLKFRLSFRQNKLHFLLDRVDNIGHNLQANGNCPAKSKLYTINDWLLPTTGPGLHSLVSLAFLSPSCYLLGNEN